MAEELLRLKERGREANPEVSENMRKLAEKAGEAFNTTMESFLAPDIELIESSVALVDETLRLEQQVTHEMLEKVEYGYRRVLVSNFGQLARYCNIIIEIAAHRLLRKSSKVVTVQQ